jgi:histidinol-phosphatase (PHP family)
MISFGIELGQPLGFEDNARTILSQADYDFVLLSLHNARDSGDLYDLPMEEMSRNELFELSQGYFQYMLASVREWDDWDSLAHLTLPARYINRRCGLTLDLRRFDAVIDEILKVTAYKGRGLEVNMSGLRNTHGESMPPLWVVKRFRELGGELLTIGSDTHKAEMIGVYIPEGMRLACEAGFRRAAFFQNRKPSFFKIEGS